MSVSYYDLLDVEETATVEEIRAAWKSAVADLDPTDRRFRAYNDAAAVLLDEGKRAAYDAELASARVEDEPVEDEPVEDESQEDDPVEVDEPVVLEKTAPVTTEPAPTATVDPAPAPAPREAAAWPLLVAAAAAVVSLVLMIVVLTWPGSLGGDSPKSTADDASTAEKDGRAAEAAAERAIPAVLGYDYRTIDQDISDAASFLTEGFAAERAEFFADKPDGEQTLRDQIVAAKAVVTAVAPATGLTRVSPAGDKATVVVFIDQESQKGDAASQVLREWATLTMLNEGGNWLIDDICIQADCD
ncbi:hypothetical protein F0U44_13355 [Nocardioides humilatus]|uniref:J domain-containing protein n=1 Tax=Nocardioides humilatus TaxID=2607660 RepID=A0A5B1LIK0_9ACTN|nr:hypothetical protein [Nocardioides humilatus]KAA1419417.1 hypothetical protein F0U44_13355 [Nocardioides humilatus]